MNNKQILFCVLFVFMQIISKVYSSEYKTDDNDLVTIKNDKSSITADSGEYSTTKRSALSEPDSGGDNNGDISQTGTFQNLTIDPLTENEDVDQIPDEQEVDILDGSGDNTFDYTPEWNEFDPTLNVIDEVDYNISDHTTDENEDDILYVDEYEVLDYSPIIFILCNSCSSNDCCNKWSLITYFLCCPNSQHPYDPVTPNEAGITEATTSQNTETEKTTTEKATTKTQEKTTTTQKPTIAKKST